jgi:TPR repeat protein
MPDKRQAWGAISNRLKMAPAFLHGACAYITYAYNVKLNDKKALSLYLKACEQDAEIYYYMAGEFILNSKMI